MVSHPRPAVTLAPRPALSRISRGRSPTHAGCDGCAAAAVVASRSPSPLVHPNGTVFLACTWSLRHAARPEGPYSVPHAIQPAGAVGRYWGGRYWEDPFLWVDKRGHFHVLSHTYVNEVWPKQSISGHGFSTDGHSWHYSRTEPYPATVARTDGSTSHFATMERPKLLFSDPEHPFQPTHLYNGASPVWADSGNGTANPCGACGESRKGDVGNCVKCKVQPGMDWTYTTVRPLKLD